MSLTHKLAPIIEVIEKHYEIPQLGRTRRISALLPYDYYVSGKTYPVLYLHDGQNLFDKFAPFGNWEVDQALEKLAFHGMHEVIIIGIDHGEQLRIQEYLPYETVKFSKNEGELYLSFMMNTLKPYIEQKYRVKGVRECTAIGGSSMGGLISLHAGMKFNEVFGKMLIFSPSIWLSNRVYLDAASFDPKGQTDMYIYAGGMESKDHYNNVRKLVDILRERQHNHHNLHINFVHNPEGKHQEIYWAEEFPHALEWLFYRGYRKGYQH